MSAVKNIPGAVPKPDRMLPFWSVCLIFLITTAVFFWPQLQGETFFWEDFVEYVYPTQSFAAQSFANGELPVWNPYVFGGMPFIADLQVGFFYPFNRLLSLAVDDSGHLSHWFLQFIVILHFFLAQLGTYLLCRYLKISSYSALIPAVSFAFSFGMVMHVIHPMIVFHLTWLPWVCWMFIKAIDTSSFKYASIGGIILGISFLAGHPQTALYEGFFLAMLMVWRWFDKDKNAIDSGTDSYKKWVAPLLTFVIAGGIFSIQLLPTQELADNAKRSEATYEYVTEGSMMNSDLGKLIVPGIKGKLDWYDRTSYYYELLEGNISKASYYYWEKGIYVGLAVLILSLTAFILLWNKPIIRFLAVFSLIGVLFAYGSNGFLFDVFYNLPFFDTFRFPIRMMFIVLFCLSIASGFAVDKLKNLTGVGAKKEILVVNSVLAVFVVIAMLIWSGSFNDSLGTPPDLVANVQSSAATSLVWLLALGFVLAALYFHKVRNGIAISLIFLYCFFDLYNQGSSFSSYPQNGYEKYELSGEFVNAFKASPPDKVFRVNSRLYSPPYMAMQRNQGLVDNIMLLEGYNPLQLDRINPFFPHKEDIHGSLNVRFELGIDKASGRPRFYERRDGIAPAWLVTNVDTSSGKEETKKMMSQLPKDSFRGYAVVESANDETPTKSIRGDRYGINKDKVNILQYENDYILYSVSASAPSLLVLSEIYYPAWKAYVNDQEVPVFIANGSLRSIYLEPGDNKVELKYESSALTTGTVLSIAAFCIGFVFIFLERGKKIEKNRAK